MNPMVFCPIVVPPCSTMGLGDSVRQRSAFPKHGTNDNRTALLRNNPRGWWLRPRKTIGKVNRDHPPRNISGVGHEQFFNHFQSTNQPESRSDYALTWFIMVHHGLWNMRFSATLKIVGFMVHCNSSGTWNSCVASIHHDLVVLSTKNGCVCAQLSMISGHVPRCGWPFQNDCEFLHGSHVKKKNCVQQWRHAMGNCHFHRVTWWLTTEFGVHSINMWLNSWYWWNGVYHVVPLQCGIHPAAQKPSNIILPTNHDLGSEFLHHHPTGLWHVKQPIFNLKLGDGDWWSN